LYSYKNELFYFRDWLKAYPSGIPAKTLGRARFAAKLHLINASNKLRRFSTLCVELPDSQAIPRPYDSETVFRKEVEMFPHHQMAVGLLPRASFYHCYVTWCCDSGHSMICAAYSGCHGGYSAGCNLYSPIEVQVAQVQPGDPVEHLQALRKGLEAALAGVEAQEVVLRKQREGLADQKK
jgi:hypothetical protein